MLIQYRYLLDVLNFGIQDPRLLSIGGNTGTTNSFVEVDISDLTMGVFNSETLTQGNNFECLVFQLIQAETQSLIASIYANVAEAFQPLAANISSILEGLSCPQLNRVNTNQYNQYPGYTRAKGAR